MIKQLSMSFAALLVSAASLSAGFDDRSGLYVGLGAGYTPAYDQEFYVDGLLTDTYSDSAFHTTFKLGGFINPNFALYYMNDVQWYSDITSESYTHGLTGVGASFFLGQDKTHQLLIGLGASTQLIQRTGDNLTGAGFSIGYGGIVSDHLITEIKLSGYSDDTINGIEYINFEADTFAISFALTYNWF